MSPQVQVPASSDGHSDLIVALSAHKYLMVLHFCWNQVKWIAKDTKRFQLCRLKFTLSPSSHRRRQWHPTPVLLPGKSHGRRSLVGCSPWGRKESDTTERLHFHALEMEMVTHSSVLAWRIPGTGEPGRLPSMGLHRVRHN